MKGKGRAKTSCDGIAMKVRRRKMRLDEQNVNEDSEEGQPYSSIGSFAKLPKSIRVSSWSKEQRSDHKLIEAHKQTFSSCWNELGC